MAHSLDSAVPTARMNSLSLLQRFDGRNFPVWKMRTRAVLQSVDQWDAVDPDGKVGTTSSSKKGASEEEELKRKKAYSTLLLALDDAHLQMVMQVEEGDARGVWKELCDHYERTTMASKAHTRGMLHRSRMDTANGESFDMYRSRVMELVSRLRGMKEMVSEGEIIYVLLEGLPKTYGAAKQALELNDDLRLDDLVKKLRDVEEKINYKKTEQT